ncbi:MAG: hypothetical protein ABI273_04750 [Lacunisphaera sp.]
MKELGNLTPPALTSEVDATLWRAEKAAEPVHPMMDKCQALMIRADRAS